MVSNSLEKNNQNNYSSFKYFDNISRFLEYSISTKNLLTKDSLLEFERYYYSYLDNFDKIMSKNYLEQSKEIIEIILKKKNLKVLDIGCGCGTESIWFAINNADVTGLELNKERLEVANERKRNFEKQFEVKIKANFVLADIFDYVEKMKEEYFDIIWMEQTYHHVEPRSKLALVLRNLLKKDGFVIISESNGLNPFLQLTLLKQRGLKTIKTYTNSNGLEKMFGIERITRKSSLIKYFTSKGFHKLSSRYYRVLPNNINLRSFTFLEYLSTKLFPFIFIHYNVVFKKMD